MAGATVGVLSPSASRMPVYSVARGSPQGKKLGDMGPWGGELLAHLEPSIMAVWVLTGGLESVA